MLFLGYFCSVSFDFLVFGFFEHGVDRSVSSKLVLNYFFFAKKSLFSVFAREEAVWNGEIGPARRTGPCRVGSNGKKYRLSLMEMLRSSVFFFPVNIKSAREPHFFEDVHGHNFAFTGTFSENSRASGCVHGHFLGLFHGHFSWFTGRKFGNLHGHFSRFTGTFSSKVPKMQEFACSRALFAGSRALFSENVHGHFWCSRALFWVHGYFFGFTGKIFFKSSRATSNVHGHFCEIVHGHFFEVHGEKKTLVSMVNVPWNFLPL